MRTHFSNQQWLKTIRTEDIETVWEQLSYFMWETSTDTMASVGVPTDDDVHEWITCLSYRFDINTSPIVQKCITDCYDYINGTMESLKKP